ncbi:hypothetical protein [Endothiovibrio diazotrophicus]
MVESFFAVEGACRAIHDKYRDPYPAKVLSVEGRIQGMPQAD